MKTALKNCNLWLCADYIFFISLLHIVKWGIMGLMVIMYETLLLIQGEMDKCKGYTSKTPKPFHNKIKR